MSGTRRPKAKPSIDYGFHLICTDLPDERLPRDEGDDRRGRHRASSCSWPIPGVFLVDDATIFKAMRTAGEHGGLICMHAENGVVIDAIVKRALATGTPRRSITR